MNATFSTDIPPDDLKIPPVGGTVGIRPLGKLVLIAGLSWIAILAGGFSVLEKEEFTPVEDAAVHATFPAASMLGLARDVPTLIFFAHPHCPCTRASMHELAGLMASLPGKVAATIVFTLPAGVAPHWERGELWQAAAAMPGIHVITDPDGREAGRFGVRGSGHVLLYQPSGQLVFSGGITPSRGHEGDNPGRSAVISMALRHRPLVNRAPVYGCPLMEPPTPSSQP